MKPVEFQSKPTLRILLFGLVAALPAAYLMFEGVRYAQGHYSQYPIGVIYLLIGAPCLLFAFLFMARAFTPMKVLWDSSRVEIQAGRSEMNIRWENIQDIYMSGGLGVSSLCIETDQQVLRISQLDFPNLSLMHKMMKEAFEEKTASRGGNG